MRKINIFGRSIPVFLIALMAIGALGTAAILTYYGTITGTAEVHQSVTLDGYDYTNTQTYQWDGETYPQGKTWIETHTLKNNADVPATIEFDTVCANSDGQDDGMQANNNIDWANFGNDHCDGITTRYVEYFDDAGATGYVAPTTCDVTVSSITDLQNAINDAEADIVICVSAGTYSGGITIPAYTFDITLASTDGPATTTIDAGNSGNGITVNGGTGTVTIEVFTIRNYGAEGIKVDGGNVVIRYNVIQATEVPSTVSSVDSIYIKGTATVTVDHNDLGNNQWSGNIQTGRSDPNAWSTAAGLSVHGDSAVTATYNNIYNNDFGIHVKGDGSATETVTANNNNIYSNKLEDFFYEQISGGSPTIPFDARDNYWGTDGIDIAAGDSTGFINVDDYIDADWMTKTDMTLNPGETDQFGIITTFAIDIVPDTYTITTEIAPAEE